MAWNFGRCHLCPVCRVSMVRVDSATDACECHSCPICGGVIEYGPAFTDGQVRIFMSSQLAAKVDCAASGSVKRSV